MEAEAHGTDLGWIREIRQYCRSLCREEFDRDGAAIASEIEVFFAPTYPGSLIS